jgi:hypothetical protein
MVISWDVGKAPCTLCTLIARKSGLGRCEGLLAVSFARRLLQCPSHTKVQKRGTGTLRNFLSKRSEQQKWERAPHNASTGSFQSEKAGKVGKQAQFRPATPQNLLLFHAWRHLND